MTAKDPINLNAYEDADLLVTEEDYDPLGGEDVEGAAKGIEADAVVSEAERAASPDEEDVMPYLGDPEADHAPEIVVDDRPASVRTAELFARMKTRRKVLLGVLALCVEPVDVETVHAKVDELQAAQMSVFNGPALCALLERAGALEQVRDEEEQQPRVVVADGVEYLEPAQPAQVRYRTTEAGKEQLDADRPHDRLHAAFEKEAVYKPIFLRILKACSEEGGKSAKELGALVDDDPLLQKPRFWAAHFFNILGECDALTWNKTWQITEVGRAAIDELEAEGVTA